MLPLFLKGIAKRLQINEKLLVDHNHNTNTVRELLCDLCNRGLGYFGENPEYLREAAL